MFFKRERETEIRIWQIERGTDGLSKLYTGCFFKDKFHVFFKNQHSILTFFP